MNSEDPDQLTTAAHGRLDVRGSRAGELQFDSEQVLTKIL